MRTYAAYCDNNVRMDSSSGGLFSLISSYFDVIYGVEMSEDNRYAVFARKIDDISSLRGSKYIQARVGDIFKQVKQDLIEGRKVLFTGTACQVNGIYFYLQKDYPNFFTIDVICHGVPTPKYWEKYLNEKEVHNVNFRSKEKGWDYYTYGMKLNDEYIPCSENKYMSLYVKDYPLRPACYECICKQNKKSDITLGDFWGVWDWHPEMTDDKGTSVVIVRTSKGQELFCFLKDDLVWKEVSYDDGVRQNPSEYSSAKKPINRDQFFIDMEIMSFDDLYKKYYPSPNLVTKVKGKIKKIKKTCCGEIDLTEADNFRPISALYEYKENCCGCSACFAVCPNEAISMMEDEEGFLYPWVHEDKCNRCGICKNVCPIKAINSDKS